MCHWLLLLDSIGYTVDSGMVAMGPMVIAVLCALVVGAETLSRLTDWSDRNTCVLFADGAGAVIIAPSETPGVLFSQLGADGRYGDLLFVAYGVSKKPEISKPNDYFLQMKGNEVFKVAVKTLESVALDAMEKQNKID